MAINGYYNTWTMINNAQSAQSARVPTIATPSRAYPISISEPGITPMNNHINMWQKVATSLGVTLNAAKTLHATSDRVFNPQMQHNNPEVIKAQVNDIVNKYNSLSASILQSSLIHPRIKTHFRKFHIRKDISFLGLKSVSDEWLTVDEVYILEALRQNKQQYLHHLKDFLSSLHAFLDLFESLSFRELLNEDMLNKMTPFLYTRYLDEIYFIDLGYVFDRSF